TATKRALTPVFGTGLEEAVGGGEGRGGANGFAVDDGEGVVRGGLGHERRFAEGLEKGRRVGRRADRLRSFTLLGHRAPKTLCDDGLVRSTAPAGHAAVPSSRDDGGSATSVTSASGRRPSAVRN